MIASTVDRFARFRTAQPATGSHQTLAELGVANPEECDLDFVLHAFDSALPYLASIGSGAQWGSVNFSEKEGLRKSFADYIAKSFQLNGAPHGISGNKDAAWNNMVLYEVAIEDGGWRRVAAMGISTSFPDYIPGGLASGEVKQGTDYMYLNYLISDRRAGELAKGAGSKLVEFGEAQSRNRGKTIFYGDCWRGNGDGLMKYYERMGFMPIGPFDVGDKHGPGLPWCGYLFSKSL